VQIGIFALSAIVSLTASVLLVSRIERVGERLGLSEALLGLIAALAADGPEITSAVTAIAGGHGTIGVGVALGSNVFNLAALLGLSALIAGRIGLHRRSIVLEGGLGVLIALLSLAVVSGVVGPLLGLLLAFVAFLPYVIFSALRPAIRLRVSLPLRWSEWLVLALAEEESDLAIAIRPRRGDRRDETARRHHQGGDRGCRGNDPGGETAGHLVGGCRCRHQVVDSGAMAAEHCDGRQPDRVDRPRDRRARDRVL